MDKYIWLFPIIFIFHDLEEVIEHSAAFGNAAMIMREPIMSTYTVAV